MTRRLDSEGSRKDSMPSGDTPLDAISDASRRDAPAATKASAHPASTGRSRQILWNGTTPSAGNLVLRAKHALHLGLGHEHIPHIALQSEYAHLGKHLDVVYDGVQRIAGSDGMAETNLID